MQSISALSDVIKVDDFCWKYADISRTQGVCNMIYMSIVSYLGKV